MDGQPTSARRRWWAPAAEWLLAACCLAPLALMPLARDQGHFAYVGQVVLDGGVPYRDVFDQKGPATHYTFAAVLALFGQSQLGVRTFFYIVALLGTRLAATLGERLSGAAARLPCVLCFSLAMLQGDEATPWHTAQVEDLILFSQLLVLWLIGSEHTLQSRWRVFAAATLLGLTCTYKPTAALPCVGLALVCIGWLAVMRGRRAVPVVRWLAWAATGFLLPLVVAVGYLAARGAFDEFWSIIVEFNAAYALRTNEMDKAITMLAGHWGRLVVLASLGALAARRPAAVLLDALIWTLIVSNWATVIWQGKYWPYHWTPMIGLVSIFAGVSLTQLVARLGRRFPTRRGLARRSCPAAATLALALLAVPIDTRYAIRLWRDTALVAAGRKPLDEFRAPFECGAVLADVHREVAEYVRSRTRKGDTLLVWGYETVVNFLADRRAPTRFAVDRVLCVDEFKRRTAWRDEFLASLRAAPPAYILVVADDGSAMWRDSDVELARFDGLHQLVAEEYDEETQIDRFHVYRRKDSDSGNPAVAFGASNAERGTRNSPR
jgi:hypothetical protein